MYGEALRVLLFIRIREHPAEKSSGMQAKTAVSAGKPVVIL